MVEEQLLLNSIYAADASLQSLSPGEIFDTASEPRQIIKLVEGEIFERKPAGIHGKELGEYFSMFANTKRGGLIAIGVRDSGKLEGCSHLDERARNSLIKAGYDYAPDAKIEYKLLPFVDEQGERNFVILFHISFNPDKLVETANGKAFHRVGDTKRRLKDEELRQFKVDRRQASKEAEKSIQSWPEDFDSDAIESNRRSIIASRGLDSKYIDAEKALELRHLGKRSAKGFAPNIACSLLYSSDPRIDIPGCRVRFTRFDGIHELTGRERNSVKDSWIEGTIPDIISVTQELLSAQLRDFTALGDDGVFYSQPEYPADTWLEAIVKETSSRSLK